MVIIIVMSDSLAVWVTVMEMNMSDVTAIHSGFEWDKSE